MDVRLLRLSRSLLARRLRRRIVRCDICGLQVKEGTRYDVDRVFQLMHEVYGCREATVGEADGRDAEAKRR